MNKREIYNLLDRKYNIRENVIKISKHNTFSHEISKCIICVELLKNGSDILTEAIFTNGLRADIIDLSSGECIEITESESDKSIEKKKTDYPLPIRAMKASDIITWLRNNKDL